MFRTVPENRDEIVQWYRDNSMGCPSRYNLHESCSSDCGNCWIEHAGVRFDDGEENMND